MKLKHTPVILALAIFAGSCSKEQISTHKTANTSTPDQTDQKYSEEVTVFDQSHKYSVTYLIASNSLEHMKAMKKDMESTTITLVNKVPAISNPTTTETSLVTKLPKEPYEDPNGIFLTETKRNTGDALGYSVEAVRQKDGTVDSYSTITITVNQCAGLYVSNQWLLPNYNFHYWNDGISWFLDRVETLSFNQNYYFTAGGYSGHRIFSQPSYINSGLPVNNRIYWTTL